MSTVVDIPLYTPRRTKIPWGAIARHVVLAMFAAGTLFSFLWVLLLSVKSLPDANQNEIWPQIFDFSHYGYSLQSFTTLPQNYWNSIVVTAGTVVITTVCAVMAGYSLVFLRAPDRALIVALLGLRCSPQRG